jgi:choline-sulfatase
MFDQLAPQSLSIYRHPLVSTPAMDGLAQDGVVFESASCNSPLCAPSRFSMLSGRYCSRIGAYDNGSEFTSGVPTMAHYLRDLGYRTCLAGKMHFVGADQLHGFEERITTDVYPADFGWTPDWEHPEQRFFWYHDMQSVMEAGAYERTLQLDFDEEVAFESVRKLYDMARDTDPRPFFMVVSFTQPHDPYMTPNAYWNRYRHDDIDMPAVTRRSLPHDDEHSRRLRHLYEMDSGQVEDYHVRNARHAYYAMISYLDDQVGALRRALQKTGLAEDTLWVVTGDHGDMLGERDLWYKMCFFERSVRVPLIMSGPGMPSSKRVSENVALLDLLPTLVDYATDGSPPEPASPLDGASLSSLLVGNGDDWADTVVAEYLAEGTVAPMLMVRRGRYKRTSCAGDRTQLFDLHEDPNELTNLAGQAHVAEVESDLAARASAHWDPVVVREEVAQSQRQRHFAHRASQRGEITPWEFQPFRDASKQYNRNYDGEMYDTDRRARIPYRDTDD